MTGFSRNLGIYSVLLLIVVVYGMLSALTPFAYDDWIFMAEWRDVNGDKSLGVSTLYEFWKDIRLYDNGRLANTFAPLFSMFSPWKELFPLVTGILVAAIIYIAAFMAFSPKKVSAFILSLVWIPIIYLLPWRNSLFVADYSLNYIWAAAITLFFMLAVVRCEKTGWTVFNFFPVLFLAFLAGGWHEGFAVPALCGFLVYTLRRRFKFSYQWYVTGIFYAAVTFLFLFCPGILDRSARQVGVANIGQSYFKIFVDFIPVIFLILLSAATALIPSLRKYLKSAWDNVWFVIGSGIVAAGVLLSLLFTHQPRSAFWPDLMAIVMIFILTRPVWTSLDASRFKGYLLCLALAVALIPMAYAIKWQYLLYEEDKIIHSKMEASESGTVYHDILTGADIPLVTLKMPNYPAWVTDFHYHALKEFTGKPYPAVLPLALQRYKSFSNAEPLQGNAGALKADNSIVVPGNLFGQPKTIEMDLLLTDGEEVTAAGLALPFVSSDNSEITYIFVYGFPVEDIKGLSL